MSSEPIIWIHEGKNYTASPLTENDWKMMSAIIRGMLLSDCKYIDDPIEKAETREQIMSTDYPPTMIFQLLKREDVRIGLIFFAFKNNKGITKELCQEFWKNEDFSSIKGLIGKLLIASGIPFIIDNDDKKDDDKKGVEDINPTPEEN